MNNRALEEITGPTDVEFETSTPLFCAYDNLPPEGCDVWLPYYQSRAFDHSPFTLPAAGASGSPVLLGADGLFLGFLNYTQLAKSRFRHDGNGRITASVPTGQTLLVGRNDSDLNRHWREYNRIVMERLGYKPIESPPEFWTLPEYCTWVEQKYRSQQKPPYDVLNHAMVESYLQKIDELGFPRGKVTIDHGWSVDPTKTGFGDWIVDEDKFPSLDATAAMITDCGHVPGIWIGLAKIHPQCALAKRYPEFVGRPELPIWTKPNVDTPVESLMHYLNPEAPLESFFTDLFRRFSNMGFRKFKIDMSYNSKHEMIAIARQFYTAAKLVDPECEIECHLPDIFGAQWTDAVRTNDVWCVPYEPWFELTQARYDCCHRSAPGRLINRDHIGGNHIDVTESNYLSHLRTYEEGVGYPVVSLLPHHFSPRAVQAVGDYLSHYMSARHAISHSPDHEVH